MNRQRKVVITVTYNELGVIVDTKAEELDSSVRPATSCSEFPNGSDDTISRQAAIDRAVSIPMFGRDVKMVAVSEIKNLPSVQPEWNNHTVACLLAELFNDTCACNYNDIDEWLPKKCELLDSCPNPVGVACWEQFLKHRAERRTDG